MKKVESTDVWGDLYIRPLKVSGKLRMMDALSDDGRKYEYVCDLLMESVFIKGEVTDPRRVMVNEEAYVRFRTTEQWDDDVDNVPAIMDLFFEVMAGINNTEKK